MAEFRLIRPLLDVTADGLKLLAVCEGELEFESEEKMLDFVFSVVDRWLLNGWFDLVDSLLVRLTTKPIRADVADALATITFAAADRLPSRDAFLKSDEKRECDMPGG
jgi:hypothetical protein